MTAPKTGGLDENNDYSHKTFIYNHKNEVWEPAADMPTARYGMACLPKSDRLGGPVTEVVVAGKRDPKCSGLGTIVEVFNVKDGIWRSGTALPKSISHGAVVPYGNTFVIAGGLCGSSRTGALDSLIKYNITNGAWDTLTMELKTKRYGAVAFSIPSC